MKSRLFLMSMALFVLVACTDKKQTEVDSTQSIIGHWEETDPLDAQFQPVTLDYVDRLFIESDKSWQSFRDDELTGSGTYTIGHTDNYIINDENLGAQDSIVFISDGKIQVECFVYNRSTDRLSFIGKPSLTGNPYKQWKRISE